MTIEKDITRYQRNSYPIILLINDDGTPVDINNYIFKFTVVKDKYSLRTPMVKTPGTLSTNTGEVQFLFQPKTFDTPGVFLYDIQMITDTGDVYTLQAGKLIILQGL